MRIHRLPIIAAALVALLTTPREARSWDSICYNYSDPTANVGALSFISGSRGCEGVRAARGRWRDPEKSIDEHRQIFAAAVAAAGLPPAVLETVKWSVFVLDDTVLQRVPGTFSDTETQIPSVRPRAVTLRVPNLLGLKAVTRAYAVDEMAQLPDFSYGLWDWASGNETCPIPYASDAERCHQFKTHMGAVNANHFPPQSDAWWDHYHQIALDRAQVCTANRTAARERASARGENPDTVDVNLKETWKACELEALTYEAIAQHYLQDSWSAGHMWERWGSTNIADITNTWTFPVPGTGWDPATPVAGKQLMIAEVVAAVAGTIHGADGPFFEGAIAGISATLHDPMCYPDSDVSAVSPSLGVFNTAGDLHLHDVASVPGAPSHSSISSKPLFLSGVSASDYNTQGTKLIACAAGSVGEVYQALVGSGFQPALGDAPSSPAAFDRASCLAPMATNLGFFRGIYDHAVPFIDLEIVRNFFGTLVVGIIGPRLASIESLPAGLNALTTADYLELTTVAALRAKLAPNGTDMARNPRTMIGVSRNSAYTPVPPTLADPRAENADAAFSFGTSPKNLVLGTAPGTRPFWLTQTFRRARAPEICTHQREVDFRVDADQLVRAARSQPDRDTLSAEEQKNYDAVCQACAEWVGAYLWNTNTWNGSRLTGAPLCSYAPGYPEVQLLDPATNQFGLAPDTTLTQPDGADTRWFAHITTQNSNAGPDAIPIGYDSPTNYLGGEPGNTPEQMAKKTCCAKLNTNGGRGNFRIHGTMYGQPQDSVVTFLLNPASAPTIEAEDYDPDWEQPILSHLPSADPTRGSRIIFTSSTERFGIKYDEDPSAKAVFDTGKAITANNENGLRYHVGNPTNTWMPAAGSYVLTPLMAMDEKRGEHCTFDPPSRTITLDATTAEVWDQDFEMTCTDDTAFHVGYPRPMQGTGIVNRTGVDTNDDDEPDKQWVIAQRVFVNGPVTLESLGFYVPHAGGGNVRMAVYKETAFNFPVWSSTATLVAQTGAIGLGDGDNTFTTGATLDKGAYWIAATFRGSDTDTTSVGANFSVIGLAWGASWLIDLDGPFEPTISLDSDDFRFFHLNTYMNVK